MPWGKSMRRIGAGSRRLNPADDSTCKPTFKITPDIHGHALGQLARLPFPSDGTHNSPGIVLDLEDRVPPFGASSTEGGFAPDLDARHGGSRYAGRLGHKGEPGRSLSCRLLLHDALGKAKGVPSYSLAMKE